MMMHEDMEALYRIKNETCFTSNYEKQLGLIIWSNKMITTKENNIALDWWLKDILKMEVISMKYYL